MERLRPLRPIARHTRTTVSRKQFVSTGPTPNVQIASLHTKVGDAQNADFAKFEERSLRTFAETFWNNRYWELAGYAFDLICCSAEISRLTDADRCPNDRNAQKAAFAKFNERPKAW